MTGFAVRPELVAGAGARLAEVAVDAAGTAAALRGVLTGLGDAAGDGGVLAAAQDAASAWLHAGQAWAAGAASLGDAAVAAAQTYLTTDADVASSFEPPP